MDPAQARRRLADARHAYLATADADGRPHLVPVTFALLAGAVDEIVIAVDHKPKRTHDLRRLRNIAANPQVALLADHYDEDWTRLWWVRADGRARLRTDAEREPALDALAARYPPYRDRRPAGPVIAVAVTRWSGWSYSS
jgi:PPOX class probable F420-dependent enzyme